MNMKAAIILCLATLITSNVHYYHKDYQHYTHDRHHTPTLKFLETEAVPIAAIAEGFKGVVQAWPDIVKAFKTTNSETVKDLIKNDGFKNLNAESNVLISEGVAETKVQLYLNLVSRSWSIPENKGINKDELSEAIMLAERTAWVDMSILSTDDQGTVRFGNIIARQREDGKYDFIRINMNIDCKLEPHILIIESSKSILGGIYESTKTHRQEIPQNMSMERIQRVVKDFLTISLWMVGKFLNFNIDLDLSPKTAPAY